MINKRYTLNWTQHPCGCWAHDWLSTRASLEHVVACSALKSGDEWFYEVKWWVLIWNNSSH